MKLLIVILSLTTLACGAVNALPTQSELTRMPTAYKEPTAPAIMLKDTERGTLVHTLGQLYVRACPSTSCAFLRVMAEGEAAYVDNAVEGDGCEWWYPLIVEPGFICKDWTSIE